MRGHHIADVMATGCFVDARFDRSENNFRTTYHAATQTDLDRYLSMHAARLRDEFAKRFPTGLSASREVWEMCQEWA